MKNSYDFNESNVLKSLINKLINANGIIIDFRKSLPINEESLYGNISPFTAQLISFLTDHAINFPAYRTRVHYGYESQTFNIPDYYQGWFVKNSSVIYPKSFTINKPICLLVNCYSNVFAECIATLQNESRVKVVADGDPGNLNPCKKYEMELADNLKVNIRLSECIYGDSSKTFLPDTIIINNDHKNDEKLYDAAIELLKSNKPTKRAINKPIKNRFTSNRSGAFYNSSYPPASIRLLGLFRYWTAINYFYPNKSMLTKNWDSVLYEYIPQFLEAKDSLQYTFTAARLIKQINDGHGFFASLVYHRLISKAPLIQLKFIENKTIIYKIFDDSLKKSLSVGDEIIAIENKSIKKCRDSIAQYLSASNNAALQRDISIRILSGETTSINIKYIHKLKLKTIKLERAPEAYQYYFGKYWEGPIWKKIK